MPWVEYIKSSPPASEQSKGDQRYGNVERGDQWNALPAQKRKHTQDPLFIMRVTMTSSRRKDGGPESQEPQREREIQQMQTLISEMALAREEMRPRSWSHTLPMN